MIIGAHIGIQSSDEKADKAFFKNVLKLTNVDAGGGFLLFGVPPSEIAVHGGGNGTHELYLMCDNVGTFIADMTKRGVASTPAQNQGWGIMTQITLPSGGKLGVYQPQHKRPAPMAAARVKSAKKAAKKVAKKSSKPAKKKKGKKR